MRRFAIAIFVAAVMAASAGAARAASDLPEDIVGHLEKDPYVYISSTRKSGDLGSAAEIWFSWDGETVLVGTSVKSYRVKRIRAGRTAARIWVENAEGPWFGATGELVEGKGAQKKMLEDFATKYGDSFTDGWQAKFEEGFAAGTRILVRYTPDGTTGRGPEGQPKK